MKPASMELAEVLDQVVAVLAADDETHWCAWMQETKRRLARSPALGAEHLLGAYGGMASFNDLVIGQTMVDGTFAWKPGYRQSNDALDALRTRAYNLASAIRDNGDR